jgi:hypothetical protein
MGQGNERRNKVTTMDRKLNKHMEGRKTGWNNSRGCYQRELPSNYLLYQPTERPDPGRPRSR